MCVCMYINIYISVCVIANIDLLYISQSFTQFVRQVIELDTLHGSGLHRQPLPHAVPPLSPSANGQQV